MSSAGGGEVNEREGLTVLRELDRVAERICQHLSNP
jgi:hypothetical protein